MGEDRDFLQILDSKRQRALARLRATQEALNRALDEADNAERNYETWERAFQNQAYEMNETYERLISDNETNVLFPVASEKPKKQPRTQKDIVYDFFKSLKGSHKSSTELHAEMVAGGYKITKHAVQNALSRLKDENKVDRDDVTRSWFIKETPEESV